LITDVYNLIEWFFYILNIIDLYTYKIIIIKDYHLSSAYVFKGVCETDCMLDPPTLRPLKACFNLEKSNYYYY